MAFYPIIDLTLAEHLKGQLSSDQLERHSLGSRIGSIAARMPPLLLVRAGQDQIPDLLKGVDRFVGQAIQANAPVVVANYPEGAHGFDNDKPAPRALALLRMAVDFLKETTRPSERM